MGEPYTISIEFIIGTCILLGADQGAARAAGARFGKGLRFASEARDLGADGRVEIRSIRLFLGGPPLANFGTTLSQPP
jgi:hypothetical protein